jgi:predicted HTH domain antitoxin
MDIIPQKAELTKHFWLYFHINGIGDEWIDYGLPIPTIHKHINRGYYIGWAIDGFFGTKKGQEFLNDIIARFLLSFKENEIKRLPFKPTKKDLASDNARIYAKVYKLREFSKQLNSLPTKKHIPQRADMYEDFTFWAIKLYAEDMIRATGFIVYDSLENWALSQFVHKERSTVRAKCRSVWNWYSERDFQLTSSQEKKYNTHKEYLEATMATRTEHMQKLNKKRAETKKAKVVGAIQSLQFLQEKISVRKVAEYAGVSKSTAEKYLKELREEGKLK